MKSNQSISQREKDRCLEFLATELVKGSGITVELHAAIIGRYAMNEAGKEEVGRYLHSVGLSVIKFFINCKTLSKILLL